jgi:WD40 repeat protein
MATAEAETSRDERSPPGEVVYDGFISYSHAADDLLAPRLQAGLQRFAKPWWKRRALRMFRDESSLSANPHLWSSITDALDQSGWFVLLLSPEAAASPWVNNEVEYWLEHKDPDRIIPVLTDGDFSWAVGDLSGDAVPLALRGVFPDEPRWVDLRFARTEEELDLQDPRFADAVADIAAAIRGVPKDELASEEVRQHRRTVRTAWGAGAVVVLLALAAGAAALFANAQRLEADQQRAIAEEEAARADANAEAEADSRQEAETNAAEAETQARLAHGTSLLASARVVATEDADLALLLAVEAGNRLGTASPDVQEVLHSLLVSATASQPLEVPRDVLSSSYAVALSPAGDRIAVSAAGNQVVIFDVATGEPALTLGSPGTSNSSSIPGIAFDETGARIAAIGTDGVARVWDAASGVELSAIDTGERETGSVLFVPGGDELITSIHTRTAWSLETSSAIWRDTDPVQTFGGAPIAIDHAGQILAWANKLQGEVKAVDVRSGEPLWTIPLLTAVFVDFHPSQDVVLAKSQDFGTEMHDYSSGAPERIHSFTVGAPAAVAFDHTGTRFVTGNVGRSLVYAASEPDDPAAAWNEVSAIETGGALPLSFSFVGSDRLAVGQPGAAQLWSIIPRGEVARVDNGWFAWTIDAIPDTTLAMSSLPGFLGGNDLWIRDIHSGELVAQIAGPPPVAPLHGGAMRVVSSELAIAYMPDLDQVATIDPTTGRVLTAMDRPSDWVAPYAVDLSRDGSMAVAIELDGDEVHRWDATTGASLEPLPLTAVEGAQALRFHPNAPILAVAGDQGGLILMDAEDPQSVRPLESEGSIVNVSFSPDGSLLAAADDTFGLLNVYDTATASRIVSLPIPGASDPEFSDDGTELLLAAAQSGIISLDTDSWTRNWTIPSDTLGGIVLTLDVAGDRLVFVDIASLAQELTLDTTRLNGIARDRLRRTFSEAECNEYRIDPCPTMDQMRSG